MTNAEKRERRREAARKAAETRLSRARRVMQERAQPDADDEFQQLADRINGYKPPEAPQPPRLESAEEKARRAESAEEKRLANLRTLLGRAREIRRESDLYNMPHSRRWHHSPKRWTAEQIAEARRFVESFVSPDGISQADPIRRKGKWRL
jgi:hypothetical protein